MKNWSAGCEIVALRRAPSAPETLAMMRARYDRGGYVLLSVVGVAHDGGEDRLEIGAPEPDESQRRAGGALSRLAAMRARYDASEYGVYIAVGTRSDGRMDRVTVYSEARSRWVANQ